MEQMTSTTTVKHPGNHEDSAYDAYLARVQARFWANIDNKRPLFTTDASGLWEAYLGAFAESERQFHNCNACRRFIERFGGLVVIGDDGRTKSAMWDEEDAYGNYTAAVSAMLRLVRKARVSGVHLSSLPVWGEPVTGVWKHLALRPPVEILHRKLVTTASQAMAEKSEDRATVARALAEFSADHIATAVTLLKTDSLYRSEKVLGQAEWLQTLHAARAAAKGKDARENVLWLAVAQAPTGFCHPRSSMIGSLLEDIAAGKDYEDVARAFKAKMHPLAYQRPQAAPSAGNIAQAEKLVEKLGIAPALRRRFARVEELHAIWRPAAANDSPVGGGVFAHLAAKETKRPAVIVLPPQVMTWEKFARTVLPTAEQLECLVPSLGNFTAFTTASDIDAPPILQWDSEAQRNPFALYVWHGGSRPTQWGLSSGQYVPVTAVTERPHRWHQPELFKHHPGGIVFVLAGARESRFDGGLALFPENMRSELREIRSTIEAHSASGKLEGAAEGSACGLLFGDKGAQGHVELRVASGGQKLTYRIDRMD